jgi:hypothetical protein
MSRRVLPLWVEEEKARAFEAARTNARKSFSRRSTPSDAIAVVSQAANDAQAVTARALKEHPPASPIKCKDGCSWCCYVKVTVSAPEVIRVADYLRRTLSAEDLARVHQRVIDTDEKTRGMTSEEREQRQIVCPLLVDRRCSVYPVRPLPCAGWVSLDVDACKKGYETTGARAEVFPETYPPQHETYRAAQAGMGLGVAQEGLDGSVLELIAALRIALDRPNASERWTQGRQVFLPAHDEEYKSKVSPDVLQGLKGDRGLRR